MAFERKNIQAMQGYTPGEQPDQADIIKLNTNENPFPPGPEVAKALAEISVDSLRQYPPPTAASLRRSITELHQAANPKLATDNVIVTNGGDELLRIAIATFVEIGETIAVAEPTYTLYEVLAAAHGCKMVSFDLDENWLLPEDFASQLNQAEAKLCLIPNPHAPTGQLISVPELEKIAKEFTGVLLVDEAYVDFVDPELDYNCIKLMNDIDNLLILRTFSKGYSLAGLRMAYGLGSTVLIDPMQYKTKDSYNTDFIAQKLAQASIEDQDYANMTWSTVREQRTLVSASLSTLGFTNLPSQSNFILATVPTHCSAETLYLALKERGVLVRYFNAPRLQDKLRITIGSEADNQNFLNALKDCLETSS